MIALRFRTTVSDNHEVVIKLPDDVPIGRVELTIVVSDSVERLAKSKSPRTSLADWTAENAEHWGDRIRSTDVEGFTGFFSTRVPL